MSEYQRIAKSIDHALLGPTLQRHDHLFGCQLAKKYDVASVCIMPFAVPLCAEQLAESTVKVSTVIGFPLGYQTTATKVFEVEQALKHRCEELDMVVNISEVLSGNWDAVQRDVFEVLQVVRAAGQKLKLIFENCYLSQSEIIHLCELCNELRVDWAKTSTGFGTGGAVVSDLKLMRTHLAEHVQLKASGGIRTLDDVETALACGATRVGMSCTQPILEELRARLSLAPICIAEQKLETGY